MAVATGVVGVSLRATAVALGYMTAEGSGAASNDGAPRLCLRARERRVRSQIRRAVGAQDRGQVGPRGMGPDPDLGRQGQGVDGGWPWNTALMHALS